MHFWERRGSPESTAPISPPLPACDTSHSEALCADSHKHPFGIFLQTCNSCNNFCKFPIAKGRLALAVLGEAIGRRWVDDAEMVLRGSSSEACLALPACRCSLLAKPFVSCLFPHAGWGHKRSGVIRNMSANASSPALIAFCWCAAPTSRAPRAAIGDPFLSSESCLGKGVCTGREVSKLLTQGYAPVVL